MNGARGTLLLVLDGHDDAPAVARAAALARQCELDIDVLCVGIGDPGPLLDAHGARTRVRRLVAEPARPGAVVGPDGGGHVLAVASPGDGPGFADWLFGTTAEQAAAAESIPLLAVRGPPGTTYDRVLVATDFSDGALAAAEAVARLLPDSALTLVHASHTPFAAFIAAETHEPEARHECEAAMTAFLTRVREAIGPARPLAVRLVEGTPVDALGRLVEQEGHGLVVAGTRGVGGPFERLLGSSALRLLDELPCDVMLVPRRGAAS